jgi:hypothetical protein
MEDALDPRLRAACRLLLGRDLRAAAGIADLDPIALKRAFRARVRECHPDRAAALGRDPRALADEFRSVTSAYALLEDALTRRPRSPAARPSAPSRAEAPRPEPAQADHRWAGRLPERPLLFGQFLYFAGRISWQTLVQALAWQRRQRPSFGRLVEGWGLATGPELARSLAQRRAGETVGEAAVRLGLLTVAQRDAVLGRQRILQRRLGVYLEESALLPPALIEQLAREQRVHNARVARPSA